MRTHKAVAIAVLLSCAGSALAQTAWNNSAGGLWNDPANWSPMDVPDTITESALLGDLGSPYAVALNISPALLALDVTANATLNINAGRVLSLGIDGLLNNGLIVVDDAGSGANTIFQAASDCSFLGTGIIELNATAGDMNDSIIRGQTGATLTIGVNQSIVGSGTAAGPMILNGTIDANRLDRDLLTTGAIDMSGGGIMRGTNGGMIRLSAQVSGGTLAGKVEASGSAATISGSTSTGDNGLRGGSVVTVLSGGMTNNGLWFVNMTGSGANTTMQSGEPAAIDGTGTIELNAVAGDMNDAILRGQAGATLTLGAGQTVTGSGLVDGPIVLNGTINADRDGRDLSVVDAIDASGGGTMMGTNNGKIRLNAQVTGGSFAGGVEANGANTTISGTTSTGDNGLRGGSVITVLSGGMTNNGSWLVNTTGSGANVVMQAGEPATINGTGTIELNAIGGDMNDAILRGQAGATLTLGSGQTVTGSGLIDGPIVLDGTFNADRDGRDLFARGSFDMSAGGTMMGTNNGKLRLDAQVTGGSFAGGVEASGSTTTISGSTSTGDNGLRGGSVITILSGGMTNNGSWLINTTGSGANVVLQTGEPATIDGTGTIELNAVGGDINDAILRGQAGATLTLSSGQTVTGSGLISGPINLNGIFNADRNARDLAVTADVDMTGGGVMMGTNGGKVALSGSATNGQWVGGVEVTGGVTNVSGVTMTNENGSRGGGVIILDAIGITIDGNLLINTNSSGANSGVTTNVSTTINGAGSIELNASGDFWDAFIQTTDAATMTLGADLSIIGRGRLSGDFILQGTLAPGNATDATNQIDINGTTTLEPTTTTEMEIAGPATADFDRLTGNSTMTLDGTLVLSLLDGFTPTFEQRFTVIDVGVLEGQFTSVVSPVDGLGVFRIVQTADKVEAVWTCQADLNGDGVLDFFDVQFFLNVFAEQALYGDYNEDGVNDFFDVQAFLNDFSAGCL